jgi:hypothetical protein
MNAIDMKHYESSEWSFALDIPKQWNSFPRVCTNSPYELIRFASREDGTHLLIVFREPHDPKQTLKEVSDRVENQFLASKGFGNFAFTETTIGSRAVLMLDFDKPQVDGTWSCRHWVPVAILPASRLGGTASKCGFNCVVNTRHGLASEKTKTSCVVAFVECHARRAELAKARAGGASRCSCRKSHLVGT